MKIDINNVLTSNIFNADFIERGRKYYNEGKVLSFNINNASHDKVIINSQVQGSHNQIYQAIIRMSIQNQKISSFHSDCSCPMARACKHIVATLLNVGNDNANKSEPDTSSEIKQWLAEMLLESKQASPATEITIKNTSTKSIIYILDYNFNAYTKQKQLTVNLRLCNVLKNGNLGASKQFEFYLESHTEALDENDHNLFAMFMLNHKVLDFRNIRGYHTKSLFLHNYKLRGIIELLVKTKRCFWREINNKRLQIGETALVDFHWVLQNDASQKFDILTDIKYSDILFLDSPWLLSKDLNTLQPIVLTDENNNKLTDSLACTLLRAPAVPAQDATLVQKHLHQAFGKDNKAARIKSFNHQEEISVDTIKPQANFNIVDFEVDMFGETQIMTDPVIELSFNYNDINILYNKDKSRSKVASLKNDTLLTMQRDQKTEQKYLDELSSIFNLEHVRDNIFIMTDYDIDYLDDVEELLEAYNSVKSVLIANGWTITASADMFYDVIDEDDESIQWYTNLNESEYNYFDYSFGVQINNEEINLLPAIVDIIKNDRNFNSSKINDNTKIPLLLQNKKILNVKYKKLKPIVETIYELYNMGQKLNANDSIKLSKQRAALLHEMAQAFKSSKMRWHGSAELRELGKKLENFKSIKKILPSKNMNATLRDYQQQGLSWLRFLNEFQLSGILADDMGLGKTIQVLASIQCSKDNNNLDKACLIIAPTSLISNWKSETEKFFPNLTVLDYHGDNRKARLLNSNKTINDYDIVISTYSLLIHEKEFFTSHEFYYLILDEAQNIKNHQAKTTLISQQIKSKHRLCLTGTPIENNLDELWSLFNFLMPGFLGNNKQFKQIFRTPIEKNNDQNKRKYLARRISPFILRRTKAEVIKELPPKTEVIHKIEIESQQRELYETIRLSMEQKVQQAISNKGLNRSHIMILDALLKLRQVCCDPRILNMDSTLKNACTSAKLIELENMLVTCIEENRKIIIFSQFVSMLNIIEEDIIKKHRYKYSKITGASKNRAEQVRKFQEGDRQIFLISLKAGGTGLNLTAADTVIHFDPWWNPAVEDQATDRAYRMGQDKPVFVYKFIVSGSVEETILKMQDKKRGIIDSLFSDDNNKQHKLTSADIGNLFAPLEN